MTAPDIHDSKQAGHTRGAALLLGPPGSGKTTLADAVADHDDIATIEAGALLRARLRTDAELSRRLKPYLEKGEMAPTDLVEPVLADRLREVSERHVLFDGFPRTEEQIAPFFALLRDHALHLRSVVVLSLSVEEAIERLSARRVCPKCGAVFNSMSAPPERPDICDRCGAALVRREDDEPGVVRRRFDVYERQTGPVVAFFTREHPQLTYRQTGTVTASQAANRIKGELEHGKRGAGDASAAEADALPTMEPHSTELDEEHQAEAIHQRLSQDSKHSYLSDAVLGGIDGCVTTFAVVAGAVGGELSGMVIIVLGFANLLADGFSMATSNYLGVKSEREEVGKARRTEERHIAQVPQGEREELRQIFSRKGFEGDVLEKIVKVITDDRKLWVDTMLTEELGLQLKGRSPLRAGLATFAAFLLVGLVPLLPFLMPGLDATQRFLFSILATGLAFLGVGMAKGRVLTRPVFKSGIETLLVGGLAAALAYGMGHGVRRLYDMF